MVCCSTWYEKLPMSMYVGSGMHYAAPPDLDSEYFMSCGAAQQYAAPPDLDL